MNVFLILFFVFINFLGAWAPRPLSAAQGTVSVSAFVPTGTFFPTPVAFAGAGNEKIFLGWSTASGASTYRVGQATVSGGPYAFTSVGNVNFFERTGLVNGTTYYFVVRSENALGSPLATSSQVFVVPTNTVYAIQTTQIDITQATTTRLSNPNGTSMTMTMPQNFLSSSAAVNLQYYSQPKSAVITAMPLPSGKLGANTFYNVSFKAVTDSSSVALLDQPVTISFFYTSDDISGVDENTLTVNRWDGTQWVPLASTIDTGLKKITVTSTQFSPIAILG